MWKKNHYVSFKYPLWVTINKEATTIFFVEHLHYLKEIFSLLTRFSSCWIDATIQQSMFYCYHGYGGDVIQLSFIAKADKSKLSKKPTMSSLFSNSLLMSRLSSMVILWYPFSPVPTMFDSVMVYQMAQAKANQHSDSSSRSLGDVLFLNFSCMLALDLCI